MDDAAGEISEPRRIEPPPAEAARIEVPLEEARAAVPAGKGFKPRRPFNDD